MPEGESPEYGILKENIIQSLEELLTRSAFLPQEFTVDTDNLHDMQKSRLSIGGTEAVLSQTKHCIDQLAQIDPDFKDTVDTLLIANKSSINRFFQRAIIQHLRHAKKRREKD